MTMPTQNGSEWSKLGWKILPWMADVLCAILAFCMLELWSTIKTVRTDVNTLKEWRAETAGNRWTAGDHAKYADEQNKRIQDILSAIANTQQTWLRDIADIKVVLAMVPRKDELPPKWFQDYVRGIEEKLDKHIEGKP